MRLLTALSLIMMSGALNAQIILTNVRYNLGTNGYDLFCGEALNEDTNEIYVWEYKAHLEYSQWTPCIMPFRGHAEPDVWWTAVPHGDTNGFFRVAKVANLYQNDAVIQFTNLSFNPITNWPSLPLPPSH